MKKEVIFILPFPWFSLYQRPHHLARQFKRSGYSVIVIEFRYLVRLNSILNRMHFEEHRLDVDRICSVIKFPWIPYLENFQFSSCLREILKQQESGIERIVWFQGLNPLVNYHTMLSNFSGKKILDVSDSFPDFSSNQREKQKLASKEDEVARKMDVVLTTAHVLYERFRKYNPTTLLIKNGVDFEQYREILKPHDSSIIKKMNKICSSKVVGYQGAISTWFDFRLVDEVIKNNPELSFLFAGMVDIRVRKEFKRLSRYNNFHYIGTVRSTLLPWVLSKIDVGIIPFTINDLIRATNPVKLYEYLAAGKPIVATPIPEVLQYNNVGVVSTAGDPLSFSKCVADMIESSTNPAKIEERIRIAEANSWESRFRNIMEILSR